MLFRSLIDEWQMAPELWDAIRYSVDRLSEEGLYILTGSTTADRSKIAHSGAGRIGRMKMSTMSLFESGDSNGNVSLFDLFSEKEISGQSGLTIENVAALVVRGGWPKTIGKSRKVVCKQIKSYCENMVKFDILASNGVNRNCHKMRQVLRSISDRKSVV